MKTRNCILTVFGLLAVIFSNAQEPANAFTWDISSKKLSDGRYELIFRTAGNPSWQLYAPNQDLGDVPTTEVNFGDSSIRFTPPFQDSGASKTEQSSLFEMPVKLYEGPVRYTVLVQIAGKIPATLQGKLLYTYGRGDEVYPATVQDFTVGLEGGVSTAARISIPSIDVKNPASPCGDDDATDKSLFFHFPAWLFGRTDCAHYTLRIPAHTINGIIFYKEVGDSPTWFAQCISLRPEHLPDLCPAERAFSPAQQSKS